MSNGEHERFSAVRQFAPKVGEQELATIAVQLIDLTSGAGPVGFSRVIGEVLAVRGDWLYVDPYSTGAARCDVLALGASDAQSIGLSAGVVYTGAFNSLKIYQSLLLTASAISLNNAAGQSVFTDAPALRVFYGRGRCPFQAPTETRGCGLLTPSAMVAGASSGSAAYAVIEGMRIRRALLKYDSNANAVATASFAEQGWSGAAGIMNGTVGGQSVIAQYPPDVQVIRESSAAFGARCLFVWRELIVPRNASQLVLSFATGTAPGGITVASWCEVG